MATHCLCLYAEIVAVAPTEASAAATAATTMIRFINARFYAVLPMPMQKSRGEPAEEWAGIQLQFLQFKNKNKTDLLSEIYTSRRHRSSSS